MKNLLIASTLFALFFNSCKKDQLIDITEEKLPSPLVSTVGSYWIYEWTAVDSNGNRTSLNEMDSVYVFGDSIIDNEKYVVLRGTFYGNSRSIRCLKDSSNCIVEHNKGIIYNFNDSAAVTPFLFWTSDFSTEIKKYADNELHPITVPAGNFRAVSSTTFYRYFNGQPYTNCDTVFNTTNYFVRGIGEVRNETGSVSGIRYKCEVWHQDLVRYHIEPLK